ncbi:hypothetical protein LQW54_006616 [Pestalotiopsis sp. IQ-011]
MSNEVAPIYFDLLSYDRKLFVRSCATLRLISELGQRIFEWDLSGLTQAPTTTVTPARVQESAFSIEGKVANINDFREYAKDGKSIAALVMIKATRVREDATNADCSHIDLIKLRLIAQLGRMAYGRITSTFDRPRAVG